MSVSLLVYRMADFGEEGKELAGLSLIDLHSGNFAGATDEGNPSPENVEGSGQAAAEAAKPQRGRGRGRGGRGKAKAAPKVANAGKRQPMSTCIVPGCVCPKYPGSKFCSVQDHKRSYDNLIYQRRTRKDLSAEQKAAFDEAMKDEGTCGREVLAFHQDNPPELKRKGLVDFCRFERIHGHRNSTKESHGDVPMTERAFYKHCELTLGLTDEEMTSWWQELYNDARIQRDNDGFRGGEQLWIPAHHMRLHEKERFVENRTVEGSGDFKAPTSDTREMLKRHLARQDQGFKDEHFRFSADDILDAQNGPAKATTTPTKAKPELPEVTPEKSINLTRERPSLSAAIERGLKKLDADLKKSFNAASDLRSKYRDHPDYLKSCDRVLLTFCRTAQFRHELVARILGQSAEILQLVPDGTEHGAGHAVDPAAAPGTPASTLTPSVLTGQEEVAVQDQEGAKRQMKFEVFLQQKRVQDHKFWDGDTSALTTLEKLRELPSEVLDVKSAEDFMARKRQWEESQKLLAEISKGLKIAADDVFKHMKVKVNEHAREKKRKADADAKDQLAKVRKEAAAAANAIKKKKTEASSGSNAAVLFQSSFPEDLPCVKTWDGKDSGSVDWSTPWVIEASGVAAKALQSSAVQKSLAIWGAQYKKALSQHKLDVVTYPVADGQGREVLTDMWRTWIPADGHVDVSTVAGGADFEKAAWLFGTSSDLKSVTATPNQAGLFKCLACGAIRHVLLEPLSLRAALQKIGKEGQDLTALLKEANTQTLAQLRDEGAQMWTHDLSTQSVLFVPGGFLQVEQVTNQHLVYGVRKSWFHVQAKEAYTAVLETLKVSGHSSVARMEAILELLSKKSESK